MKNELTRRNQDYDFFEEAMQDFFPSFYGRNSGRKYMRTDIKESDDAYTMEVELPGLDKKDIHVDLKDGYLNISAEKSEHEEGDKEKKDNYIHRERSFSCSRSYYVGDVAKEDVKAKYENGMLTLVIPKEAPKAKADHRIEIE